MEIVYSGRAHKNQLENLFYQMDVENTNRVSLDNFFCSVNHIGKIKSKNLMKPWDEELNC